MRIVIHAGLPKTGTTYLQKRFVLNRPWLASRGVAYPTIGQEFAAGHHNLAFHLLRQETPQARFGCLSTVELMRRVLRGDSQCVLLSSEAFGGLSVEAMRELADALRPHQVEWVLFVRRRSALCASRWQEEVKHGSTLTFPEFVTAHLLGPETGVLRIENPLAAAMEVFGREALRLVVYDHLVEDGIDLFAFFARRLLGLDPDGMVGDGRVVNRRLAPEVVEALRALNCVHAERADSNHAAFLKSALESFRTDEGQRLLRLVADALETQGEDLQLGTLDEHWAHRDHEIMNVVGGRFLNAHGSSAIFRPGSEVVLRVLPPSALYARVPVAAWEEAYDTITGAHRRRLAV